MLQLEQYKLHPKPCLESPPTQNTPCSRANTARAARDGVLVARQPVGCSLSQPVTQVSFDMEKRLVDQGTGVVQGVDL